MRWTPPHRHPDAPEVAVISTIQYGLEHKKYLAALCGNRRHQGGHHQTGLLYGGATDKPQVHPGHCSSVPGKGVPYAPGKMGDCQLPWTTVYMVSDLPGGSRRYLLPLLGVCT